MSQQHKKGPAPYWNPLLAGILLGMVLLATFVIKGHGLGATGFTTRLTAWIGMYMAPNATNANDYLGGMVEEGAPLNSWITWQVLGVAIGALLSAFFANRIALKLDGQKFLGGATGWFFARYPFWYRSLQKRVFVFEGPTLGDRFCDSLSTAVWGVRVC